MKDCVLHPSLHLARVRGSSAQQVWKSPRLELVPPLALPPNLTLFRDPASTSDALLQGLDGKSEDESLDFQDEAEASGLGPEADESSDFGDEAEDKDEDIAEDHAEMMANRANHERAEAETDAAFGQNSRELWDILESKELSKLTDLSRRSFARQNG